MKNRYILLFLISLTVVLSGCATMFSDARIIQAEQSGQSPAGTLSNPIIDSDMTFLEATRKESPLEFKERQKLVNVVYYSFDGKIHKGQLVIDERLVEDIREVFRAALKHKFPIASVIPISHDRFFKNGKWNEDDLSMAANNTSAFNYRVVTGGKSLSKHAYGFAIDINPLQNPYIKGNTVLPPGAVYDINKPGTLAYGLPVVKTFLRLGWTWGGNWKSLKDYQHFEKVLKSDIVSVDHVLLKDKIVSKFNSRLPYLWAEVVPGVKTKLATKDKVIALTFDACGSSGDGYDSKLINFLIAQNIKAVFFINGRWIDKNPKIFRELSGNPLFEIANHGFLHKPCSINGKSQYEIAGTKSSGEVVDEIELNARKISFITGSRPRYYRSGTAFYDEVGVEIANILGHEVIGFSILGDAGASYSKEQVKGALLTAGPGSIVICHMNHPEKETAEGVIAAIPLLRKKGFTFVGLSEYKLE